ncbi:MAG: S41 family peptidase [Promethearchaeota archaeon]
MDPKIQRDDLIQDIRDLTNILENAHPDPYIRGGGKIVYHRRLQNLIREIPPKGMSRQEFFFHLRPFIAKIGDGHTAIYLDQSPADNENPGGIPLFFDVVDEKLYVDGVTDTEYLSLIGCILVSVEGVAFEDLVKRQAKQVGYENIYHLIGLLGKKGSLFYGNALKSLVPEWKNPEQIEVVLLHPSGKEKSHTFPPSKNVKFPLFRQKTNFPTPETNNKYFSYHFMDSDKNIAFLQLLNMTTYREAFEYWNVTGMINFDSWSRKVYTIFNNKEPPEDINARLIGIPAATETFLSLVKEMNKENTKYLIVDLRQNFGGFDAMIHILLYFLIGFEKTISLAMKNAEVRKLSEYLHKDSENGIELDKIHYRNLVPLTINDYDFSQDPIFSPEAVRKSVTKNHSSIFEKMPSFFKEFRSGEYEAHYLPKTIIVLCTNSTFSSGFNLMTELYHLGAILIGTPSAQAGNSFGNCRTFKLSNSKLTGMYSTKYFIAFPDDPEKGRNLLPHYQLTYEKLASYDFDPNSIVLYALDIIKKLENEGN